jgi:pantothenate kinase
MTKEDIATGSHYEHSWEPRVAKLILEQLQKHRSNHISNHNKNKSQSENNDNNNDNNNHNDASDDDYDPASWSDDGTTTSGSQKVPPPFMVALVGVPGGGKSVSSFLLANFLEQEFGVPTMIMPHDGYHLPMEQLRQFPDAADKIYRRGAPDTFDPLSLQRDLDRIRNQKEEGLIMVPGFDHARGDPEPDARAFDRYQHQVVIAEGLVRTTTFDLI